MLQYCSTHLLLPHFMCAHNSLCFSSLIIRSSTLPLPSNVKLSRLSSLFRSTNLSRVKKISLKCGWKVLLAVKIWVTTKVAMFYKQVFLEAQALFCQVRKKRKTTLAAMHTPLHGAPYNNPTHMQSDTAGQVWFHSLLLMRRMETSLTLERKQVPTDSWTLHGNKLLDISMIL